VAARFKILLLWLYVIVIFSSSSYSSIIFPSVPFLLLIDSKYKCKYGTAKSEIIYTESRKLSFGEKT
jgi:hypothetical protein